MSTEGSVYSACRTKPGTALGGRIERSWAGRGTKDRDDEDRLLGMLLDMDEEQLDQIMQCEDETSRRLLTGLCERGFDQESIKQMKCLREGGQKSEEKKKPRKGTATDAVFSSAAANNYYQAIGYRLGGIGSAASNDDDDDVSSKNVRWKGLKDSVASNDNDNDAVSFKNISWKGLKEDASAEGSSTVRSTGSSKTEGSSVKRNVDKVTKEADKRRTEKLLAEALKKKKTSPTEIAHFLMKAEKAKRKEEEEKMAQKSTEKLIAKVAEYLLKFEEEKKASKERKMNKHLVKDVRKRGGKTPAEIAAREKEMKDETRWEHESEEKVVKDAFKQGKTRSGVAAYYLLKAEQEKNRSVLEKEVSKARPSTQSSPPLPPVKSLDCHRLNDEVSTTSSVTNHFKSVSSIATAMSSECSIVTEIAPLNVIYSSSVASKKMEKKSSTSSFLRGMKPFSKKGKVELVVPVELYAKLTLPDERSEKSVPVNDQYSSTKEDSTTPSIKDDRLEDEDSQDSSLDECATLEDSSKESEDGPIDTISCYLGVEVELDDFSSLGLVSEGSNGENQEIALADTIYTGYGVNQEDDHNEEVDDNINDCESISKSISTTDLSSPKKQTRVSKAKSGIRALSPFQKWNPETVKKKSVSKKLDFPPRIPSRELPPRIPTRSVVSSPPPKAESNSLSEDSSHLWDDIAEGDEAVSSKEGQKNISNSIEKSCSNSFSTASKIKSWDEPSVLKKWWSETSRPSYTLGGHLDDESSTYSRTKNTEYSGDSVTFVDDDNVEQGCFNSLKDLAIEVKGYKDEISLIAREVREFCVSTALSTESGLQSVRQQSSDMLGCDTTDVSKKLDFPPRISNSIEKSCSNSFSTADKESASESVKQAKTATTNQKVHVCKDLKSNTKSAVPSPPPSPLFALSVKDEQKDSDGKKDHIKGKLKRIMNFKKKSSMDKKVVDQKKMISEDTSDGTEETDTGDSNESPSVNTEYIKDEATDEDQNKSVSEWFMDGPVTSIILNGSDLKSDDGVSLPSVLRKASKITIWDEPSVLKKWWSETSRPSYTLGGHLDDESSTYSRTKNTEYSGDSVTFVDDDNVEQGCFNSLKDLAIEVKGYKDEISLIAREVREFCVSTALSTESGLQSVRQQASDMLGCDTTDPLQGVSSGKTNQLTEMMQTKVMGGDDEHQKEAVAIAMEATMVDDHASKKYVRSRTNEMKIKRKHLYLSKLRNVSLSHI